MIVVGSTLKGLVVGLAAGFFARKVRSVPLGIAFGLVLGLLFAYWVASQQRNYYLEIMLPGSLAGAMVGYATQKFGRGPEPASGGGLQ
jgi:membrane associated rhomboid family serine protease